MCRFWTGQSGKGWLYILTKLQKWFGYSYWYWCRISSTWQRRRRKENNEGNYIWHLLDVEKKYMQSSANKCIYLRSGKCFFTICSSCSVETKPSLVFSFSSLNFKGIFLILFLSQPSFWEILHLESFFFLLFSQNSLISPSPLFLQAPFLDSFFRDLDFSFFSFSCFFSCHHALFCVKAGWARWWRRGRIHHNRPPAPLSFPLRNCSYSLWFVASWIVSSRPLAGQVVFVWVVWDWLKQLMGEADI